MHHVLKWLFSFRAGGTVGAVLTCPLEVVKTRLQSSVATFSQPVYVTRVMYQAAHQTPVTTPSYIACTASSTCTQTTSVARPHTTTSTQTYGLYRCLKWVDCFWECFFLCLTFLFLSRWWSLKYSIMVTGIFQASMRMYLSYISFNVTKSFSSIITLFYCEVLGVLGNDLSMTQLEGKFCCKWSGCFALKYIWSHVLSEAGFLVCEL